MITATGVRSAYRTLQPIVISYYYALGGLEASDANVDAGQSWSVRNREMTTNVCTDRSCGLRCHSMTQCVIFSPCMGIMKNLLPQRKINLLKRKHCWTAINSAHLKLQTKCLWPWQKESAFLLYKLAYGLQISTLYLNFSAFDMVHLKPLFAMIDFIFLAPFDVQIEFS